MSKATEDDISDIASVRQLPDTERTLLLRAVAGDIEPAARGTDRPAGSRREQNRDLPFWLASRALLAIARLSPDRRAPSRDSLVVTILSPDLARPAALKGVLAGRSAQAGTTGLGADAAGLHLALPGGTFTLAWRQACAALTLLHFYLYADGASRWEQVAAALDPITAGLGGSDAAAALGATTSALAAIARDYRKQHFDLTAETRRADALARYIRNGRADIDQEAPPRDAEILSFWRAEIKAGERPFFATIVTHAVVLERLRLEARLGHALDTADGLHAPGEPDAAPRERTDLPRRGLHGAAGTAETFEWPEALLDQIPTRPNILKGPDRAVLDRLLRLHPLQFGRQRTILRLLAFHPVHSTHVTNRQLHAAAPIPAPQSYGAIRAGHGELRAKLTAILTEALALRRRQPDAPEEPEDPVFDRRHDVAAADAPDLVAMKQRRLPAARRMQLQGLATDPDARAAQFAEFDMALARIATRLDSFQRPSGAPASPADEGFSEDAPLFLDTIDALFRS